MPAFQAPSFALVQTSDANSKRNFFFAGGAATEAAAAKAVGLGVTLGTQQLEAIRDRNNLDTALVDDVIMGVVSPVGEQGSNIARSAVMNAKYAETTAGFQLNRFCASGLEAVNVAAAKVMSGEADFAIGGGVEAMSRVPMGSDGVIAVAGNAIYFSQDGITWLQINKISSGSGDNYTTFTGLSASVRTGQGQATFALFESSGMDYGEIFIADNSTKDIFSFRMEGTGALNTRTFYGKEIQPNGANTPIKYITSHDHHICIIKNLVRKEKYIVKVIQEFQKKHKKKIMLKDLVLKIED